MGKREDFLNAVQTLLIVNSVRLATEGDHSPKAVTNFSFTNGFNILDTALDAADWIPEDLPTMEAVNEFCSYFFQNLRDNEPEGMMPELPYWCARS